MPALKGGVHPGDNLWLAPRVGTMNPEGDGAFAGGLKAQGVQGYDPIYKLCRLKSEKWLTGLDDLDLAALV